MFNDCSTLLLVTTEYQRRPTFCYLLDVLDSLLGHDIEGITKEQDDEIMKMKQRQMFLDDVGVTVAMISVTLLAVLVVILKVVVFSDQVINIYFNSIILI